MQVIRINKVLIFNINLLILKKWPHVFFYQLYNTFVHSYYMKLFLIYCYLAWGSILYVDIIICLNYYSLQFYFLYAMINIYLRY